MSQGKEVYLRKKVTFGEDAMQDPAVQSYFGMGKHTLGSYYKDFGRVIGSGLTQDELKELIPFLTGIYPEDDKREFNSTMRTYFSNLSTTIPQEGKKLQIGLENPELPLVYWENDKGEISKTAKAGFKRVLNMPIKIDDYVRYRHALGHPLCAKNLDTAQKYWHIKYYIDDPQATTDLAVEINDLEDEAQLIYHNTKKNDVKVTQILTLLGVRTKGLQEREKVLVLKEKATANEDAPEVIRKKELETFLKIAKDKKLAQKYEVEELIRTKILERHGTRILITESGEEIGVDMEDAVGWLLSPENSKERNVLKVKYQELNKKSR